MRYLNSWSKLFILFLKQSMFEASEALQKPSGIKKLRSMLFHQYSWNSEVETTWISLICWAHRTSSMYWIYKVTYLQLSNLFLSTEEHWLDSIHQHKAGTSPRILWLWALQWRIRCRRTVWPQKRLKNKIIEWLLPNNYVWNVITLWTVNDVIF